MTELIPRIDEKIEYLRDLIGSLDVVTNAPWQELIDRTKLKVRNPGHFSLRAQIKLLDAVDALRDLRLASNHYRETFTPSKPELTALLPESPVQAIDLSEENSRQQKGQDSDQGATS